MGFMNFFTFFFSFLREIFFDTKEEADFRSRRFKPKRWMAFFLTVSSLLTSYFLAYRLVHVIRKHEVLRYEYRELVKKTNALEEALRECRQKINPSQVPSTDPTSLPKSQTPRT